MKKQVIQRIILLIADLFANVKCFGSFTLNHHQGV